MPQNVVTFSYIMQVPMEEIVKNANFAYQYFFCYYASLEMKQCKKIYNYIKTYMKEDETFNAFKYSNIFFDVNWECELPPLVEVDGFMVNIPKAEQVYPRYQGHSNL